MNGKMFKLMLAGAFVVCAVGGYAVGIVWATPPQGFTATNIVGPVVMDEIDTRSNVDGHKTDIKTKGFSDVYITSIKIVPGGHGGWHSHPGPSFIAVKSGTATVYCACANPIMRTDYAAGSAFVEDAGCVHTVANEGTTDLEIIVMQIVPLGAPRRIDEPAP